MTPEERQARADRHANALAQVAATLLRSDEDFLRAWAERRVDAESISSAVRMASVILARAHGFMDGQMKRGHDWWNSDWDLPEDHDHPKEPAVHGEVTSDNPPEWRRLVKP